MFKHTHTGDPEDTAELMKFLMGVGNPHREQPSQAQAPKKKYSFKVFTPPPTTTTTTEAPPPLPSFSMESQKTQLPTSASIFGSFGGGGVGTTAEDSELLMPERGTPEPTAPGQIPVFKAVPERLRITGGDFPLNNVDIASVMPELADQVISLDGEQGHSFMAFKMGSSAAVESAAPPSPTRSSGLGLMQGSMMDRLKKLQQETY